jgi:hypothetical protein
MVFFIIYQEASERAYFNRHGRRDKIEAGSGKQVNWVPQERFFLQLIDGKFG